MFKRRKGDQKGGYQRHPFAAQKKQKKVSNNTPKGKKINVNQVSREVEDFNYAIETQDLPDQHECYYIPVIGYRSVTACSCGNISDPNNEIE